MGDLSGITAICVDTRNHELALEACGKMSGHGFADLVLVTDDAIEPHLREGSAPDGLRIERIAPLRGRSAYSNYVLRHLADHVRTSHALIFQWDGYVVNPGLWRPEFLDYDYVGAPFPAEDLSLNRRVGNGGFCLRSMRLLRAAAAMMPHGDTREPEDRVICGQLADRLEQDHGIRFAPVNVAKHFSTDMMSLKRYRDLEPDLVAERTFGFHGFYNLHLVLEDDELLELVDTRLAGFRDELLASFPTAVLIVNLMNCGRHHAAAQLALRCAAIFGLDPRTLDLTELLARCEARHVG